MEKVSDQQQIPTGRYGANQNQAKSKSFAECASTFAKALGVTFVGVGTLSAGAGAGIHGVNSTDVNVIVPPPVNQPVGLFLIELGAPIAAFGALLICAGYGIAYFTKPVVTQVRTDMPVGGYQDFPGTEKESLASTFDDMTVYTEEEEQRLLKEKLLKEQQGPDVNTPLLDNPNQTGYQGSGQMTGGSDTKIPLDGLGTSQTSDKPETLDGAETDGHSGSEDEVITKQQKQEDLNTKEKNDVL